MLGTRTVLRLLGLALVTSASGAGVGRLVRPALGHDWSDRGSLTLEPYVAAACAAALAICWLWLATGVWWTVLATLGTGQPGRTRLPPALCPRVVRSLALLALGLGVATPAYGDPGAGPGLAGLPLPDRVAVRVMEGAAHPAAQMPPAPRRLVRVRPGDSLWTLTARSLPAGVPDSAVDRAWRVVAAVNSGRLGADPDLIFPGTLLRVPGPGRLLGKDA
jgi:hypothetical protein